MNYLFAYKLNTIKNILRQLQKIKIPYKKKNIIPIKNKFLLFFISSTILIKLKRQSHC